MHVKNLNSESDETPCYFVANFLAEFSFGTKEEHACAD